MLWIPTQDACLPNHFHQNFHWKRQCNCASWTQAFLSLSEEWMLHCNKCICKFLLIFVKCHIKKVWMFFSVSGLSLWKFCFTSHIGKNSLLCMAACLPVSPTAKFYTVAKTSANQQEVYTNRFHSNISHDFHANSVINIYLFLCNMHIACGKLENLN